MFCRGSAFADFEDFGQLEQVRHWVEWYLILEPIIIPKNMTWWLPTGYSSVQVGTVLQGQSEGGGSLRPFFAPSCDARP